MAVYLFPGIPSFPYSCSQQCFKLNASQWPFIPLGAVHKLRNRDFGDFQTPRFEYLMLYHNTMDNTPLGPYLSVLPYL